MNRYRLAYLLLEEDQCIYPVLEILEEDRWRCLVFMTEHHEWVHMRYQFSLTTRFVYRDDVSDGDFLEETVEISEEEAVVILFSAREPNP